MDNENDFDKVVDEAYWEIRAISAGMLPKQIITHNSEYYYSIHEDRSRVDQWIEKQKLLERKRKKEIYEGNVSLLETKNGELSFSQERNLSIVKDYKIIEEKSFIPKLKQLYQAARRYLSP